MNSEFLSLSFQNECVKYIPNANRNYTNAVAMEDEDVTSFPPETPDDDVSMKTPGSQETLLDDLSDTEAQSNHEPMATEPGSAHGPVTGFQHGHQVDRAQSTGPTEAQRLQKRPMLKNCPRFTFEGIQRENSEDLDVDHRTSRDSDATISEGGNGSPRQLYYQTGTGFSQSENSLTDRNQVAYGYGNQVEYSMRGGGHGDATILDPGPLRASSAPPTPEAVRRVIYDHSRYTQFSMSISSEPEIILSSDDDDDDDDANIFDDVTLISASCQSPPLYTQAQSPTSCQVTNLVTNQATPEITVQSPSGFTRVTYSTNRSPPPMTTQKFGFQGSNDDCYGYSLHSDDDDDDDESEDSGDEDLESEPESDTQSIKMNPNSIENSAAAPTDTTTPDVHPPEAPTTSTWHSPAPKSTSAPTEVPTSISTQRSAQTPEERDPRTQVHLEADPPCDEDSDSLLGELSYGERRFLLDPAFEGMEPTFV